MVMLNLLCYPCRDVIYPQNERRIWFVFHIQICNVWNIKTHIVWSRIRRSQFRPKTGVRWIEKNNKYYLKHCLIEWRVQIIKYVWLNNTKMATYLLIYLIRNIHIRKENLVKGNKYSKNNMIRILNTCQIPKY